MNNKTSSDKGTDGASDLSDANGVREALNLLVGYHLRRASVYDLNGAVAALELAGARPITLSVLLCIVESPGRTSADICRNLGIKRANIVALLQSLEAKGLFLRSNDPTDQRIQRLYPTKQGVQTAQEWLELIRTHEERTLKRLSQAERAELRRLLQMIWEDDTSQD
ncbi:MarR family transcriptional regulator [Rhizobium sp. FY34]|uniref:MarR family winged helix-turn-helix transcriptional regulator n=1 Tax=Rhizobium sp. FY34 TaxID=2562309 RepID=UPI0010C112AD|nr:MarR family transcriptional regulator [Rhizobium sp. FY34]